MEPPKPPFFFFIDAARLDEKHREAGRRGECGAARVAHALLAEPHRFFTFDRSRVTQRAVRAVRDSCRCAGRLKDLVREVEEADRAAAGEEEE